MDTLIHAAVSITLILAIAGCVLGFDAIFRSIRNRADMDAFRARVDATVDRARGSANARVQIDVHQPAGMNEAELARLTAWALRDV